MKPTHLITLSKYVDSAQQSTNNVGLGTLFVNVRTHNDFLKQPVTLSQFVPCKNGVPLGKPEGKNPNRSIWEPYNEAHNSIVFEGWEVIDDSTYNSGTRVVEIKSKESKLSLQFYYNGGYDGTIGISKGELRSDNKNTLSDLAAATIENPLKLK